MAAAPSSAQKHTAVPTLAEIVRDGLPVNPLTKADNPVVKFKQDVLAEAHGQPDWVRAFLVMLTHGMGLQECAMELNQSPDRLLMVYNTPGFKAMLQERVQRGGTVNPEAIQGAAVDAFLACHAIVLTPSVNASVRVKAASIIMDRAWGKVPDRVVLPDRDLPADPAEAGRALQSQILDAIKADPALREAIKTQL